MSPREKIVLTFPINKLWNAEIEVEAVRGSYLKKKELKDLLKNGPVEQVNGEVLQKVQSSYWRNFINNRRPIEILKSRNFQTLSES